MQSLDSPFGKICLDSGRVEEALTIFEIAAAWAPNNWWALYYAGVDARICGPPGNR